MPILNIETLNPKIRTDAKQYQRLFCNIRRALKLGESIDKVADDVGLSNATIKSILKENGTSLKEIKNEKYGRYDD